MRIDPHSSIENARVNAVVLVEGLSDRNAVEALAERRGRDLAAEGVEVVPIGGAQAIGRALDRYGPRGLDVRLAGLVDAGEEREFRRALERAGLGAVPGRVELEALGFFVCEADLEDELIRACGAGEVVRIVEANGDLNAFRTLQKQPEWRGRPADEQLRRFMGSGGSRKVRYARLLVEALDLERMPRPLDLVLRRV
jgi:OLD-like protein